ncbi:MAG: hypothetical protein JWN56_306 [Sphingobacteriales bacterium]|nr:hypothetical protein [Sphingobacteriales bacterium]
MLHQIINSKKELFSKQLNNKQLIKNVLSFFNNYRPRRKAAIEIRDKSKPTLG